MKPHANFDCCCNFPCPINPENLFNYDFQSRPPNPSVNLPSSTLHFQQDKFSSLNSRQNTIIKMSVLIIETKNNDPDKYQEKYMHRDAEGYGQCKRHSSWPPSNHLANMV